VMTPEAISSPPSVGKQGGGADGDLVRVAFCRWRQELVGRARRSTDVASAAREGLHTMVAGGQGVVFAAWLDLRLKGTRLYGSTSHDGGATWSPNTLVYESPSGSVCQCCHPSAAVDGQGRIFVMFRNSIDGNRDMYLVRSDDGGKKFGPATNSALALGNWTPPDGWRSTPGRRRWQSNLGVAARGRCLLVNGPEIASSGLVQADSPYWLRHLADPFWCGWRARR